jgi:hypothetical protein
MAAILRLAGGFDHSHSQQVQAVIVCRDSDGLEMRVVAPELPEVDIWGARRRAEFFENVFQTRLTITWQPSTRPGITTRPESGMLDAPSIEVPAASLEPTPAAPAANANGSANGHSSAEKKPNKRGKRRPVG